MLFFMEDSNDQNQVADQRFSLKQWFARGSQSRGLRKLGSGHCYLRFFVVLLSSVTIRSTCKGVHSVSYFYVA